MGKPFDIDQKRCLKSLYWISERGRNLLKYLNLDTITQLYKKKYLIRVLEHVPQTHFNKKAINYIKDCRADCEISLFTI